MIHTVDRIRTLSQSDVPVQTPATLPRIELSHEEIAQFLTAFTPEWVFVTEAVYERDKLFCKFATFDTPFRKPPVHLTRNHVIMFATQATYVLAGTMAKYTPDFPLKLEHYLELVQNEQATFTEIRLKFKKFIKNEDGIGLFIWCDRFRKHKGKLVAKLAFEFPLGCVGESVGVLALDTPLVPGIDV